MTPELLDAESSDARVERAATALSRLLQARPAGLLTDVDGTISRITAQTTDATVSEEARQALTRLTGELDVVAVVTGRAVGRAVQMVGVDGVRYIGNHGLEWLHDGVVEADPAARAARPNLEAALSDVRAAISERDLVIEDKGVSLAIHYRLAAEPLKVEQLLLQTLERHARKGAVRVIEGLLVVNVLPALATDKGAATRRLVEQHGLRAAAFFGDDVTDLDAFRVLQGLRAEGAIDCLTIGVGSPEGPPQVRSMADLVLEGVPEVERVLAALANRLSMRSPGT